MRRTNEHFRGCLLGGAVGDALGAPIEFQSLAEIRSRYSPDGIREFSPAYGRTGAITDDTQMTLFTAEGLLRAAARAHQRGICHIPGVVHRAYLRWLHTQGETSAHQWSDEEMDGWLYGIRSLHARRAPGNTCLSALSSDRERGLDISINQSKGCGTVMRIAPVGLVPDTDAFQLGCELAAITHSHPTGILAAGCLAEIIYRIIGGQCLRDSIGAALDRLSNEPQGAETAEAVRRALGLADGDQAGPEKVEQLGGGWVAEEALAIALYCALINENDFAAAVRLAVNHSGDSDSTGAITGNLMGALLGKSAIPDRWLGELELRSEIETIADDMLIWFREGEEWLERYPGW